MSEYDYQSGIGFGAGVELPRFASANEVKCKFCNSPITFKNRAAFNLDGTQHRCMRNSSVRLDVAVDSDLKSYATKAMQAIVSGLVHKGGKDAVHAMDTHLLADAAWGIAIAMKDAEDTFTSREQS